MEDKNEKWAKFIWNKALQRSTRTLTWGFDFNSIGTTDNGTEFHCIGNKLHGIVKIQHQDWSNTFQVTITPDDEKEEPIVIENVMLEDLVSVIDESITYYHDSHNLLSLEYANVA